MTEIEIERMKTEEAFSGRRVIYTHVSEVTRENLLDVLHDAQSVHDRNASEISYLYNYYKGVQPILFRSKSNRPEICNKIVENRANEIVSFKVGYLCGEPIQYVSRSGDDKTVQAINTLNEYMFAEDKAAQDQELVEWQMICGTAYRAVYPDDEDEVDEAPFELYTLDPRSTFIVYSADMEHKPVLAVRFTKEHGNITYAIHTKDTYFKVYNDKIVTEESHAFGMIPIFEYPANNARLGSFEIVLPLLDSLNDIDSNRLDDIEQNVQAFLKFINCKVEKTDIDKLRELGAIMVKTVNEGQPADVDVVSSELNQTQIQAFKTDLYNAILTICGMPNRNGGSSTSDTGSAVLLRDGWSDAEARAKDSENVFKRAEKKMLRMVLKICNDLRQMDLKLKDVEMKFTRRNYDNIQSKTQVLISMLNCQWIHPQLAFQSCGIFSDAQEAYTMSEEWHELQMQRWEPVKVDEDEDKTVQSDRPVSKNTQAENTQRV